MIARFLWVGLLILIAVGSMMVYDARDKDSESMEARVEILERQMKQKIRPVINVARASIYNSDGEIVIEEHEIKY